MSLRRGDKRLVWKYPVLARSGCADCTNEENTNTPKTKNTPPKKHILRRSQHVPKPVCRFYMVVKGNTIAKENARIPSDLLDYHIISLLHREEPACVVCLPKPLFRLAQHCSTPQTRRERRQQTDAAWRRRGLGACTLNTLEDRPCEIHRSPRGA